jgi:hydroxyacylglutathione hydrolase
MLLKRFYDTGLAQASYLVGCQRTGEAIVIDPNRDVEQYLEGATAEGMRIAHVTETHIHADFLSGSRELARKSDARLHLSDEGGADWKYAFAGDAGARLLRHGDVISVGNVRLEVLHTPGHTPEHICFLLTDGAAAERPMGVFTGDFVFVGDVGRPDLLERAAKVGGTMEESARLLHRSLQTFKALPDYLQIWPGHGAGSACGKSLGAVPQSTIGYERFVNWAFQVADESTFVQRVLEGQPEPPKYFAQMKKLNRDGPADRRTDGRPSRLSLAEIRALIDRKEIVIDTRSAAHFARGHVPGTINIPLTRTFVTWAGWLVPYDRKFHLIADAEESPALDSAIRELSMIGLDAVGGYAPAAIVAEWERGVGALQSVEQISVQELARRRGDPELAIIDVMGAAEWEEGHLPGVPNIPVGFLADRISELPEGKTVVVHCQTGARSSIAASLLQARGVSTVMNLRGGYAEWEKSGLPVEREVERELAGARP